VVVAAVDIMPLVVMEQPQQEEMAGLELRVALQAHQ
jgi:hypothetical protein